VEISFAQSKQPLHKPSHLHTKNGSRGTRNTSNKKKTSIVTNTTQTPNAHHFFLLDVAHRWSSAVLFVNMPPGYRTGDSTAQAHQAHLAIRTHAPSTARTPTSIRTHKHIRTRAHRHTRTQPHKHVGLQHLERRRLIAKLQASLAN